MKKSFVDQVEAKRGGTRTKLDEILARGETQKSSVDSYIATQGHNIHKLKAKDSTGRWAYYFLLVPPKNEGAFMHAIGTKGNIDLENYGTVVASCYGEEPTEDVKQMLRERYGFVV